MLIFLWCVVTDWIRYALTTTVHNRLLFSAKIWHHKLPSTPETQYNSPNPFYFTCMFLPDLAHQQRNGGIFYGTDWLGKLQAGDHCARLVQSAPVHIFSFAIKNCICGCLHCLVTSGVCKFPNYPSSFSSRSPPLPLFSFFIPLFSIYTSMHVCIPMHIRLPSFFRWLKCCRYSIHFILFIFLFRLIFRPGSVYEFA